MNFCTLVVARILPLISMGGAVHPAPLANFSGQQPPQNRVAFKPLSVTRKAAVLKQFGARYNLPNLNSDSSGITLSAQFPYYSPLDASLSVVGASQAFPAWNRIIIQPNEQGQILVVIGKIDPTKNYIVTFNIVSSASVPVTLLTGQTTASGGTAINPFQPTANVSGATQIPIVILPGSNSAQLMISLPSAHYHVIVQEVTIEVA